MTGRRPEPVGVDEVALIVTTGGCWMPTAPPVAHPTRPGRPVRPPVTSVGQLARILTEATARDRLRSVGTTAQVWVLGEAVDLLGWAPDPVQRTKGMTETQVREATRAAIADRVAASAGELRTQGWRLRDRWREGGYRVRLERIPEPGTEKRRSVRVDVVLEPYAWTTGGAAVDGSVREKLGVLGSPAAGTGLPDADTDPEAARLELGRRLEWCVRHLGMLPAVTGATTAASIISQGWKEGAKINEANAAKRAAAARGREFKGRDVVVPPGPGPIPPFTSSPPVGDIEPRLAWWRLPSVEEITAAAVLAVPDRRGSYLGSAGAALVLGEPTPLTGEDIDADPPLWFSAETNPYRWPRGLWLLALPAPELVPDWDVLPPLHNTWWRAFGTEWSPPSADAAGVVLVWVTTETAAALAADPSKGGYGLDWCQAMVPVLEGWVWERAGTALKPWQTLMSRAYKTAAAEGDRAMKAVVGDIYKSYIGRLHKSPEDWGQWRRQHSQPVWRAQIHALTTVSIRRKSAEARARIHAATGCWVAPFAATTDDTTWLLPAGVDPALLSDDTDGNLGRMVLKATTELSDADRAELVAARATALEEGRLAAFTDVVMRLRKTSTGRGVVTDAGVR